MHLISVLTPHLYISVLSPPFVGLTTTICISIFWPSIYTILFWAHRWSHLYISVLSPPFAGLTTTICTSILFWPHIYTILFWAHHWWGQIRNDVHIVKVKWWSPKMCPIYVYQFWYSLRPQKRVAHPPTLIGRRINLHFLAPTIRHINGVRGSRGPYGWVHIKK